MFRCDVHFLFLYYCCILLEIKLTTTALTMRQNGHYFGDSNSTCIFCYENYCTYGILIKFHWNLFPINSRDPTARCWQRGSSSFHRKNDRYSLHLPYQSPFSIMTVPCQRSLPPYRPVLAIFDVHNAIWRHYTTYPPMYAIDIILRC